MQVTEKNRKQFFEPFSDFFDLIASRIPPGGVVESTGVDDMMQSYTSIH